MTAALSLVVQHLGIGACPHCLTCEQRLCPDPWLHTATATCPGCEAMWDYCGDHGEECPAVAIARLSVTCKAAGLMRNPVDVQVHVQARKMRLDQFVDIEDPDVAVMADAYGLIGGYDSE